MGLTRQQGLQALLSGAQGSNPYAEGSEQRKTEQLRALLAPKTEAAKKKAANEADIEAMQDPRLQDQLHNGGSVKVGDVTVGADPYAHMIGKQQSGDAAARMQAQKIYNSGLPKIQAVAQAAREGLDSVNDPQNIGSLGQARTLMLKSMGMNRYNEQEAKAVLPPTLFSYASSLFNQGGDDSSPLNAAQRSNINQFFKGQLDNANTQHSMLKQNAMGVYTSSPYMTQQGMQAMSGLGAPMEASFQQAQTKYKDVPVTQGPDLTSKPTPSLFDKLRGFLSGAGSAPAQSAPQATQAPGGFDPDAYLKGK